MPLSVVIHTKNAAATLKKALLSIKFADQVVVIDMESSDETLTIAEAELATIFSHPDLGYADPARNFGLQQASHDWILVLDADEEVSLGLQTFIQKVVTGSVTAEEIADAYYLPRQNIIFGQPLRHTGWWPDYQLRLFKKGVVQWQAGVHRLPDADGKTYHVPAEEDLALIHHNYQTVEQFLDRLNRYTSIKAKEVVFESGSSAITPSSLSASQATQAFGDEFLSRFFAQRGDLDGTHGLSLSFLQAMYELVVQLKVWQASGFPPTQEPTASVAAVAKFQQQLSYWVADWHVQHGPAWQRWWWQLRRKYQW